MTNVSSRVDEESLDKQIDAPAAQLPVEATVAVAPVSAELTQSVVTQAESTPPDLSPATPAAASEMYGAAKTEIASTETSAAALVAPAIAAAVVSVAKPAAVAKSLAGKSLAAPVVAPGPQKSERLTPTLARNARTFVENHGFKVAGLAIAVGAGWLLGANTFENEAAAMRMIAAIETLDTKVEAVAAQAAAREDISALRASVEKSSNGLDATRNNAAAAVAQLTNKFDRAEREHAARFEKQEKEFSARLERLTERLDRAERAAGAHAPTASISQLPASPAPVTLPSRTAPQRLEETRVPQGVPEARAAAADRGRIPANGYVLREVRDGAALVEGRAGLREVIPGDVLPGVGRVRSIERRGKQWVVVTSGGVIDAAGY